eukprot:1161762-Pelagomonas_calceolata.AAC.14
MRTSCLVREGACHGEGGARKAMIPSAKTGTPGAHGLALPSHAASGLHGVMIHAQTDEGRAIRCRAPSTEYKLGRHKPAL